MEQETIQQLSEETFIVRRDTGAIPARPVTPRGRACIAPAKGRPIKPLEACEVFARREVHEEEMEELIVGLIVVQNEFQQSGQAVCQALSTTLSYTEWSKAPTPCTSIWLSIDTPL